MQTSRDPAKVAYIEAYLKAVGLYLSDDGKEQADIHYTAVLELNLDEVVPCMAGPKRPHDKVAVSAVQEEFVKVRLPLSRAFATGTDWRAPQGLTLPHTNFKGFGLKEDETKLAVPLQFKGQVRMESVRRRLSHTHFADLRAPPRRRCHCCHHVVHEHVQPIGHARRRPAGTQRRRAR
jgi:hypothetical protein